ncbi:uncharacterized protein NEMAJ01_0739 [Nematocida major]|uniref:uncharacterized protein n=1 Tax=Nematocida major TaxID=1912982 RepID=UPI0020083D6C|nr:uncharacterized protein NEMAJ01_0739 [Nematocida major]KAH9385843.1 hypothetical protein NEMAJ01_0739 [Nematocida major]
MQNRKNESLHSGEGKHIVSTRRKTGGENNSPGGASSEKEGSTHPIRESLQKSPKEIVQENLPKPIDIPLSREKAAESSSVGNPASISSKSSSKTQDNPANTFPSAPPIERLQEEYAEASRRTGIRGKATEFSDKIRMRLYYSRFGWERLEENATVLGSTPEGIDTLTIFLKGFIITLIILLVEFLFFCIYKHAFYVLGFCAVAGAIILVSREEADGGSNFLAFSIILFPAFLVLVLFTAWYLFGGIYIGMCIFWAFDKKTSVSWVDALIVLMMPIPSVLLSVFERISVYMLNEMCLFLAMVALIFGLFLNIAQILACLKRRFSPFIERACTVVYLPGSDPDSPVEVNIAEKESAQENKARSLRSYISVSEFIVIPIFMASAVTGLLLTLRFLYLNEGLEFIPHGIFGAFHGMKSLP